MEYSRDQKPSHLRNGFFVYEDDATFDKNRTI